MKGQELGSRHQQGHGESLSVGERWEEQAGLMTEGEVGSRSQDDVNDIYQSDQRMALTRYTVMTNHPWTRRIWVGLNGNMY